MSSAWIRESIVPTDERPSQSAELGLHNLNSVREAALTLLREVESLRKLQMMKTDVSRDLHEEVQRFEIELIKQALQRTRGNQRRAARLLGVKVTTLNCKIKRFGISLENETDWSMLA